MSEFYKSRKGDKSYPLKECKKCYGQKVKEWKALHPERVKEHRKAEVRREKKVLTPEEKWNRALRGFKF